ncbi:MAG: glycosyltransferase family 39 protein [Planctomycetes bacterium]|nr:glycosyltransferase family 39 protein [Planctomycetota bacterium]
MPAPENAASVAPRATCWTRVLGWAALIALFFALRLPAVFGNSATYDEPIYLGAGKHFAVLRDDRAGAMLYHPPLAYHLSSAPLWFLDVPLRPWDAAGSNTQVGLDILYGSAFRGAPVDPETVLLLARLPILLAGLLALPLLFAIGRRLGGTSAGWLAAIVWATFPEAAAQSALATTDCVAAVAAFGLALAALRHLEAARAATATSRRTLVVLGVATGLALLSKHTLLVHVAVTAAALLWMRALTWRSLAAAAGIAAFVVWAGYLFEFRAAVPATGSHETLDAVARRLGIDVGTLEGPARTIPIPAPTYFRSVADAFFSKAQARSGTPWVAYMHGEWSARGFWTYFPYATFVKTPIALLAFVALGLAGLRSLWRDRRDETALVLALFAVPFAAAIVSRLNIGFRHVLPALPFLFVVAAAGFVRLLAPRVVRPIALLGAAALLTVAPVLAGAATDPIPYANVLAGGPPGLHAHLADSNLEIGQDLRRVADWAREHDVDEIAIYLHGPPGLAERETLREPRFRVLAVAPTGGLLYDVNAADQQGPVPRRGLLAVGESVMVTPRWRRLVSVPPLATVGRTRIYVMPR